MPKIHSKSNSKPKNSRTFADVFEKFGIGFNNNGSAEAVADACPWCRRDRFYLNIETGLFHCKHCQQSGNVSDFLTWIHRQAFDKTTDDHRRVLKAKRGIGLQTLKRHELAFDVDQNCWLIPFKNKKRKVVNLQSYSLKNGRKYNLPRLGTSLYNLDCLSSDKSKIVFLFEAPFDLIAMDFHLGLKRAKYDLVASPGAFKEDWVDFFRGRKVRALFDNDDGGEAHGERVKKLLGESRVASELRVLRWPKEFSKGCDINDLVSGHPDIPIVGWSLEHSVKVTSKPKLIFRHGRDRKAQERKPIDWPWHDHLRCGTYCSFSGEQGTMKSTIAGEITARYTQGEPMPLCKKLGMPAGHVLYLHAEDDEAAMWDRLEVAGADLDRVTLMPATLRDGDPLNVLEHLEEIEALIREYGIRLVILDGQNSVVGCPNISTDMNSRFNVTNRLHQFAQRLNICLIGVRNEDPTGRAMGPQSMGDIGRCVWRAVTLRGTKDDKYFQLVFTKISDASPKTHPPIPYSVKDLGGNRRKILWGKTNDEALKAVLGKNTSKKEAVK